MEKHLTAALDEEERAFTAQIDAFVARGMFKKKQRDDLIAGFKDGQRAGVRAYRRALARVEEEGGA